MKAFLKWICWRRTIGIGLGVIGGTLVILASFHISLSSSLLWAIGVGGLFAAVITDRHWGLP